MKKLIILFAFIAIALTVSSQNVIRGEYFIDSDPGFGRATPFSVSLANTSIAQSITIPYNEFADPGYHYAYFRTLDENGNWSLTDRRLVEADEILSELNSVMVEYFFKTDNGFGNNSFVLAEPSAENTWNFDLPFDQLPLTKTANDTLFLRIQDGNTGEWSFTTLVDSLNIIPVGINEIEEVSGVKVFPNPFSDELTISAKTSGKIRVALYNESGQLITQKTVGQSTQINTQQLKAGSYIILLYSDNRKIYQCTILKSTF